MKKPCEYCGCDLPLGVDKDTRRIRSRHFSSCKATPSLEVESPAPVPTSWMEMVTVNLLREGVNKHKARELAEHFYSFAPAAQPAIPDAFGTREGEHPQYIEGWNDCRAEMLKGMKP